MKENIDLNRSREFGDIISDTFVVVKHNFKPLIKAYFVICGLFLIADILVSSLANTSKGESHLFSGVGFFELLFDFINYVSLILTTLSYYALYKEKGNHPPEVVEVWGYFKYYFFRVFFTQLLLAIATTIGFFICFLPGVYLGVVFSLVTPIMVIENGNIEYSIKKAFKIISENWWFTFGIILIVTIIILLAMLVLMVPPMIIYGSSQWLTGKNLDGIEGILQSAMINLCQLLWIVPITSIALVYFSVIEQKEANSLINRIKLFGNNATGTDQLSSEEY